MLVESGSRYPRGTFIEIGSPAEARIKKHFGRARFRSYQNSYRTEVGNILKSNGGTILEVSGSRIRCYWNMEESRGAFAASKAALQVLERMDEIIENRASGGLPVCIGICTGSARLSRNGKLRMIESPFSRNAFLESSASHAHRLQACCRFYFVKVLVAEETEIQLRGRVVTREIDDIYVLRPHRPKMRIYELLEIRD